MKRINTQIIIGIVFLLFITEGCKWIENAEDIQLGICQTLDEGFVTNPSNLDSVLTSDFVFTVNTTDTDIPADVESYTRTEFIDTVAGSSIFDGIGTANISSISIADSQVTANMDYSYVIDENDYSMGFVATLVDEGDFFTSDWKVSVFYWQSYTPYSYALSIRLHGLTNF